MLPENCVRYIACLQVISPSLLWLVHRELPVQGFFCQHWLTPHAACEGCCPDAPLRPAVQQPVNGLDRIPGDVFGKELVLGCEDISHLFGAGYSSWMRTGWRTVPRAAVTTGAFTATVVPRASVSLRGGLVAGPHALDELHTWGAFPPLLKSPQRLGTANQRTRQLRLAANDSRTKIPDLPEAPVFTGLI